MSAALLEYVETTQLVNDLTSPTAQRPGGPPNLMPIKDPATVRTQASTATEIAEPGSGDCGGRFGSLVSAMEQPPGEHLRVRRLPREHRGADAARPGVPVVRRPAQP